MSKSKTPKKTGGVKKAIKVTSIIIKILLIMAGLALIGFFVWLATQIGAWIQTG